MSLLNSDNERKPRVSRRILNDQLKLLIRLRWVASVGIVTAGIISTLVFPVLSTAKPIYVISTILFGLNFVYSLLLSKKRPDAVSQGVVLCFLQIELDLILLTLLLHFSGGTTNPFVLFYVFHVILATIILSSNLSFSVAMSSIAMFGLMAVGELNDWGWLSNSPLLFSISGGLSSNPVYMLGEFVAFATTITLAQFLTRMVITRMTAKELEAARNHDVLRAMIKAMAEGLIFVTADGIIPICNPSARQWAGNGESNKEVPSLKDFPPVLSEHIEQLLDSEGEAGGGLRSVKFNLDNEQESYIEAKSCPVADIDGRRLGYVIVGQDLTDHKKLERDLIDRTEETVEINEMLKRSRIEMAQREKMVAIGQMATGIAHEIGNPLASLSSVAQYLGRKLKSHEEKEHLLMIENQVHRISVILRRMLSLSRPATSEYKWTDVNAVIDNTLALVKFDRRAKSVDIINEANDNLPMIWVNPLHFEQVLLNITINALDAMSARESEDQHSIMIEREFKDNMIEIRISDTGIGMEPEVCKRAFESFFTTKEIGKGTGLGLYISYNLISEIDGSIKLDSEPGVGTTVTIRVPMRPKGHLISGEESEKERASGPVRKRK